MRILIERSKPQISEEIARRVWAKSSIGYKKVQLALALFGFVILGISYSLDPLQFWSISSSIGIAFILTAILTTRSTLKSKDRFFQQQAALREKLLQFGGWQHFEITESQIAYSDALITMTMKWDAVTSYSHEKGLLTINLYGEHIAQWAWLDTEFNPEELHIFCTFLQSIFKDKLK